VDEKVKVNASYNVTKLLPNLIKDCRISCRTTSSFSKMAHLLTQQLLPKTGPRRNALVSLEKKTNGHRIRQISIHWIIMCGVRCWDAIRNTRQNRPTLPSWRLPSYRHGMICYRSSLIRQSCHFERDFDRLLLQLVDILNTQFKYREGSWHSSLKRLNCCAKFDSLFLNIQDATARSLEKVNFTV